MRILSTCAAAAALALLASAGSASAQEAEWSFNLAATTDYVFRGFSQTQEDPAIQGGVDVTVGSFYAGAWASNVDFLDSTDAEVDIYGGYRGEAAGFAFDLGVVGYLYTNAPSGADYDYVEFKAAASRAFGPVTAGAAVYYSPDFTGPVSSDAATYVEVNAAYSPIENLTLSAALGEQYVESAYGDDYTTWNVGASYTIPTAPVVVDVRYHDTDVDNPAVPISDGRVAFTMKVLF